MYLYIELHNYQNVLTNLEAFMHITVMYTCQHVTYALLKYFILSYNFKNNAFIFRNKIQRTT